MKRASAEDRVGLPISARTGWLCCSLPPGDSLQTLQAHSVGCVGFEAGNPCRIRFSQPYQGRYLLPRRWNAHPTTYVTNKKTKTIRNEDTTTGISVSSSLD